MILMHLNFYTLNEMIECFLGIMTTSEDVFLHFSQGKKKLVLKMKRCLRKIQIFSVEIPSIY
jgi:hypothetical protein